MNISILFDAMRRESALPNSPAWKMAGIIAMIAVGAINTLYPIPVTLDQIATLIGVVFAIYTQIATTEKIGLRAKGER